MWYDYDIGLEALNKTADVLKQKSKNNPKLQRILETYTKNVCFFDEVFLFLILPF